METVLIFIGSLVIMFVGLIGVILPFLPGVPLAWLGLFLFAILTEFQKISANTILIFFGLTILTLILDLFLPILGAKRFKASKQGMFGAFLGLILGILIFNFWGILIGPLLGALIGELVAKKDSTQAAKSAFGAFIGFLTGVLIKVVFIFIMIGFLVISLF
ncbi:DUF456 domain-containing protein [Patescibacteria group bacterium]